MDHKGKAKKNAPYYRNESDEMPMKKGGKIARIKYYHQSVWIDRKVEEEFGDEEE